MIGGFNLVELTNNLWKIEIIGKTYHIGTFREVVMYLIVKYNFRLSEIDIAVQSMAKKGHNSANFGIYGSFIYSFNQLTIDRQVC